MAKQKKQKSQYEIEFDDLKLAYQQTAKKVPLDPSQWGSRKMKMALDVIAKHPVRAPSKVTKIFYQQLFTRLSPSDRNKGGLDLNHAVGVKNTVLLKEMLNFWDNLTQKTLALTKAVKQGNTKAVQILAPISDVKSIAVYCIQLSATIGNKQIFDVFEPHMDWSQDDCYTARFCALRCADTMIEEQKKAESKGLVCKFEKTRLPSQYQMLVEIIRKNNCEELKRRLVALSKSRIGGAVVERGEKGLEIFYQAYDESVLKERLMTATENTNEPCLRRKSKM